MEQLIGRIDQIRVKTTDFRQPISIDQLGIPIRAAPSRRHVEDVPERRDVDGSSRILSWIGRFVGHLGVIEDVYAVAVLLVDGERRRRGAGPGSSPLTPTSERSGSGCTAAARTPTKESWALH